MKFIVSIGIRKLPGSPQPMHEGTVNLAARRLR